MMGGHRPCQYLMTLANLGSPASLLVIGLIGPSMHGQAGDSWLKIDLLAASRLLAQTLRLVAKQATAFNWLVAMAQLQQPTRPQLPSIILATFTHRPSYHPSGLPAWLDLEAQPAPERHEPGVPLALLHSVPPLVKVLRDGPIITVPGGRGGEGLECAGADSQSIAQPGLTAGQLAGRDSGQGPCDRRAGA